MLPGLLVTAAGPQARHLTLPGLALTGNSRGATTEPVLRMRKQRSEGSSGTRGRDTAMLPRFCQLWGPGALAASRTSVSSLAPGSAAPRLCRTPWREVALVGWAAVSDFIVSSTACDCVHFSREGLAGPPASSRGRAAGSVSPPGGLVCRELCTAAPSVGPQRRTRRHAAWMGWPGCGARALRAEGSRKVGPLPPSGYSGLAQQRSAPQSLRGSRLCQGVRSVLHLGGEGASQQVPGWLLGSAWTWAPVAPSLSRVIPGAGCLMPGAVLTEGREAQAWHARVPAALMGQQVGGQVPRFRCSAAHADAGPASMYH